MTFAGDLNAQCIETLKGQRKADFDVQRSFAFLSYNMAVSGVFGHFYYNRLEMIFPQAIGGLRAVLAKLFVTQGVWVPFGWLPGYLFWTGSVQGRTFEQNVEKLRTDYHALLLGTWSTGGLVCIMMFRFIPIQHQVGFSALGHFVVTSMMSLMLSKERPVPFYKVRDVKCGQPVCDSIPDSANHIVSGPK
eukprot:CAMPEP_0172729190 /NCGR_PEP_ID=MMETSP1074-20121228/94009_1 /TAXON_ID=2916 /ORGANISM="Ceratium fusus, Strain PA161109" /LENGTH=189 /DNA_ID=CAMNT_0013556603 /DNA_START=95 /DNA_END=664 /DNA_ORIENTATION=-